MTYHHASEGSAARMRTVPPSAKRQAAAEEYRGFRLFVTGSRVQIWDARPDAPCGPRWLQAAYTVAGARCVIDAQVTAEARWAR